MFCLFKSKISSDVNKPIIAGSLLNLVNQSKEVKNIYSVSIEDIFAVIKGRIEMWSDDVEQLRQAYLEMVEMIDKVKYGE